LAYGFPSLENVNFCKYISFYSAGADPILLNSFFPFFAITFLKKLAYTERMCYNIKNRCSQKEDLACKTDIDIWQEGD
jgi:hypothetical protein